MEASRDIKDKLRANRGNLEFCLTSAETMSSMVVFLWFHFKYTNFFISYVFFYCTMNSCSCEKRCSYLCSTIFISDEKRSKSVFIYIYIESINCDDITFFDDVLFSTCFNNCNHNFWLRWLYCIDFFYLASFCVLEVSKPWF